MPSCKILPGVYWVGAIDSKIRHFHGHTYTTQRGTTYNAYLIVDEKIALIDTVHTPFTNELLENIKEIIPIEKIDYIVANHVERDHSGALPALHKLCPKAVVVGTVKCKEGLYKNYYGGWDFKVVKTGDKLSLGKRALEFIEVPMLHWPDSMFTYIREDALLLPNDAFGQHYATSERFDDEVEESILMDEATKYYANILWPLSALVTKKIEEIVKLNLPIKMIAPSHGVIWRKSPEKIIKSYLSWAKNDINPKAVVAYETMWGSTEIMAKEIAKGISDNGISAEIFDINKTNHTEIIGKMLSSKGYVLGSSTHDNDMLPNMAGFLEFLKGLKPKNRMALSFGSYGWAGGALKSIEKLFENTGVAFVDEGLKMQYVPSKDELKKCYERGIEFALKLKEE